jgi:hypothetical protein
MTDARTLRIRELNDAFRTTLSGGKTFFFEALTRRYYFRLGHSVWYARRPWVPGGAAPDGERPGLTADVTS